MFRARQTLRRFAASKITEKVKVVNEDGEVVDKLVDYSAKLPSPENFRLSKLLKAGVNLQRVNSRVIDGISTFDGSQLVDDSLPVSGADDKTLNSGLTNNE